MIPFIGLVLFLAILSKQFFYNMFGSLISWLIKKRFHQIELFMKYPFEVQNELFDKLIISAQNTEWGKLYGYESINDINTFKARVPVNDYDGFVPWIERVRNGEQNVLWHSDIKHFAKSSGTTSGKSKFIPVSNEALEDCHYKAGKDLMCIYLNMRPDSQFFQGKGLVMGGSHTISEIKNETYYTGDLSAILMNNLPFWVEFYRTPSLSIALMSEWEEKIEKMARVTMTHDVTNISGVPSWSLLLLKRILEISGKNNICEVWPNLEVFFHGGVSFLPYREQFRKLIPSDQMFYMETYNASEGFFGIQDCIESNDMLLMLDYGIFYEFMPVNELGSPHPLTLQLEEVSTGVNYAIIISTNGGLWRYLIGDTIMFTSLHPFRIKITGRTKNFINAFGEELIVDNAERALKIAAGKCNAIVLEFTAAPVYIDDKTKASHQWLIEFETEPSNLGYFAEILDNALKSLNSDYEAKRYKDMVLQRPEITSVPPKTFYNWLKLKGKLGGQHKVPRLSNNRIIIDEILELIHNKINNP